jgi:uncharacterized protein
VQAKPGDHPDFFRFPTPEGRSRESTIVLDRNGRFWHDGEPILHEPMSRAFASWIRRHPLDGRFILSNHYDWTYFQVEDVPYFVTGLRVTGSPSKPIAEITLSDGSVEALEPAGLRVNQEEAVVCRVKGGAFEAKFTPASQLALAPLLEEAEQDGAVRLHLGNRKHLLTSPPQ